MIRIARIVFCSGAMTLVFAYMAQGQILRLPLISPEVKPSLAYSSTEPPTEAPVYEEPLIGPSFDASIDPHEGWSFLVLPDSLIYKSYLAGAKESRMGAQIYKEKDGLWFYDATLGGRIGLFRYGDRAPIFPQGFQLDVEGSAQVRLDIGNNVDVNAVDFRGGVPLTYGSGRHQTKFAYYHLSSHVGDEFLLRNPGFVRLNYARDVLVLGHSINLHDDLRIYAEAGWAFFTDVAKEWEFQFGLDYAPARPTGPQGAPFFAINGHLREELDYGGNLTVQTGWAWRSDVGERLFRLGLHYFNGKSNQFSFFNESEEQFGVGIWYDF